MRSRSWIAWLPFLISVGLAAGGIAAQSLKGENVVRDPEAITGLAFALLTGVGLLILRRHPHHPFGHLLSSIGFLSALTFAADKYAQLSVQRELSLPGETFSAWIQNFTWFLPLGVMFTLGLLWFPTGEHPGGRWKWVQRLAITGNLLMTAAFALHRGPLDGFRIPNPTGVIPEDIMQFIVIPGLLSVLLAATLSVAALVVRFRRSSGIERQQLKLVTYAAAAMVLIVLVLSRVPLPEAAIDYIFGAAVLLFPASCAVAILKHGLYGIDLVVNRTIVYLLLSVLLALVYFGGVAVLQGVIGFGGDSDLAVAASTLAVAGLFQPARRRIQGFIDHYFYRRKYDAQRTIDDFSSRLRDEIDLDSLKHELADVVFRTMQPSHLSVWVIQSRIAGERS